MNEFKFTFKKENIDLVKNFQYTIKNSGYKGEICLLYKKIFIPY